jgi:hypothetical protein
MTVVMSLPQFTVPFPGISPGVANLHLHGLILKDKHMTAGKINQVAPKKSRASLARRDSPGGGGVATTEARCGSFLVEFANSGRFRCGLRACALCRARASPLGEQRRVKRRRRCMNCIWSCTGGFKAHARGSKWDPVEAARPRCYRVDVGFIAPFTLPLTLLSRSRRHTSDWERSLPGERRPSMASTSRGVGGGERNKALLPSPLPPPVAKFKGDYASL